MYEEDAPMNLSMPMSCARFDTATYLPTVADCTGMIWDCGPLKAAPTGDAIVYSLIDWCFECNRLVTASTADL